jgi:hypothetical protein
VLLCSAGVLGGLGFLCLALGGAIGTAFHNDVWATVWNVARWPAGLLVITAATVLILRRAPESPSAGLVVAVVGPSSRSSGPVTAAWTVLQRQFDVRPDLGPLAGIVLSALDLCFLGAVFRVSVPPSWSDSCRRSAPRTRRRRPPAFVSWSRGAPSDELGRRVAASCPSTVGLNGSAARWRG